MVKTVSPTVAVGVAEVIGTQVVKLSAETCSEPVHDVEVVVVMVLVFIASEKVTATVVFFAMPVALLAGLVELTVGAVVSMV
jgi:hypothetical protein